MKRRNNTIPAYIFLLLVSAVSIYSQPNPLSNLVDNIQDNDSKPCIRKCYKVEGNSITFTAVKCLLMNKENYTVAEVKSNPDAPLMISLAPGQTAELGFTYSFTGKGTLYADLKLTGNKDIDVELTSELPWSGMDTRTLPPGSKTLKCNFKNYSDKTAEAVISFVGTMTAEEGNSAVLTDVHVTLNNK